MTSNELITFRKSSGVTQAEFAKKLRVSIHAVRKWEQGKTQIPQNIELLVKLLKQT